ncbi:MAG: type I methionyl aminopeptidase [Thomasclavelia sp.]|jgi:methionyl aminopeptidase|nr:type I methionyl aminopeptidase [Thomasclavelia sp.]
MKEIYEKLDKLHSEGIRVPEKWMIKSNTQIKKIKDAAVVNNGLLDYIEEHIKAGLSTDDINDMAIEYLKKHNARSADYNYEGYPKHLCTSINDVVCHGIPSKDVILKDGDIINVDCTTQFKGYNADASRMFMIGNVSKEAKDLVDVTKECLEIGCKSIKPWKSYVGDIGIAIEKYAHEKGYSVVREFCGHGIGKKMHEDPYVFHFNAHQDTVLLVPGMVITIEPMINQGKRDVCIGEDDWTIYTVDGKLTAQWEYTILITEEGYEIISK